MIRKILAAAAVAMTAMTFGGASDAEAKTRVYIGVGVGDPFYYPRCDYSLVFDDCRYYGPRYRYYRPRYYQEPRYVERLTCREARRELRARGYRDIAVRDCNGRQYSFNATRRGRDVRITMSSRSGEIISVRRR
jgi:hypothetical protein